MSENDFRSERFGTHFPTVCSRKLCNNLVCCVVNKLAVFLIVTDRFVEKENLTVFVLNLNEPGHFVEEKC